MTLLLMSWGEENFTSTKQCVHLQKFTSREINDGASLSKHCTTLSSNNVHNKQPRASHKHRPTEERPSDNSCGSSRSSRAAVTAGTAVIAVCSEHAPKQLVARLILSYGRWKLSILLYLINPIESLSQTQRRNNNKWIFFLWSTLTIIWRHIFGGGFFYLQIAAQYIYI